MTTKNTIVDSIEKSLAILDQADISANQFLVALSVASRNDQAKAIIAKAMSDNCAKLVEWLNAGENKALESAVKNHVQRLDGRYASRTHTLALQGGVWSYVARTLDDIEAADRAALIKQLAVVNVVADKTATLATLTTAKKIVDFAQRNESVLKEAGINYDVTKLDTSKAELLTAEYDTLVAQWRKALAERKALYDTKTSVISALKDLPADTINKVADGLNDKLRTLPLNTKAEIEHAKAHVDAVKVAINHNITAKSTDLPALQAAVVEVKDKEIVDLRKKVATVIEENRQHQADKNSLDFALNKDDFAKAQALRNGLTTLISGWLAANREHTSADARIIAAKTLHDYAAELNKQANAFSSEMAKQANAK